MVENFFGEVVDDASVCSGEGRQCRREIALGAQGLAYVEREYRWPTVMAKLEALLAQC